MIIKIEMSHKIPIPMTLCSTIYSKSSAMEFRRFMAFSNSGKLPVEIFYFRSKNFTSGSIHSRAPSRQNQKSDKNLECSIFKVVIMSHNYDIRGPNLEFISPDFEFLSGNGIFIFAPYFRKIIIK